MVQRDRADERPVKAAITGIGEDARTPIEYPNAIFEELEQPGEGHWVSDAEVAEVPFTAFTSRRKHEHVECRLVVRRVMGNHHPSIAPYGLFTTGDGAIQIAVGCEGLWQRILPLLCEAATALEYATNASRVAHRDQLIALIEDAFAIRTSDDLLAQLADLGVPAGKVRTLDDVYRWGETHSQGLLLVDVDDTEAGTLRLPGPALRARSTRHRHSHHPAPARAAQPSHPRLAR